MLRLSSVESYSPPYALVDLYGRLRRYIHILSSGRLLAPRSTRYDDAPDYPALPFLPHTRWDKVGGTYCTPASDLLLLDTYNSIRNAGIPKVASRTIPNGFGILEFLQPNHTRRVDSAHGNRDCGAYSACQGQ